MANEDNPLKGERYLIPHAQKGLDALKRVNARLKPVNDRWDWLKGEQAKLVKKLKEEQLQVETSVLVDTLKAIRESIKD